MVVREHGLLWRMFAAANFSERLAGCISLPMTPWGLRRPQHLAGCGVAAREEAYRNFGD